MLITLFAITACSDYSLAKQTATPDAPNATVEDTTTSVVENDTAEPPDENTDIAVTEEADGEDESDEPVDPTECGFVIDQPLGNPNVETESLAIFSNIGDMHFEIRQGETARYQFAVTALECGGIDLNFTNYQVDDEADCADYDCWIGDMALSHLPMYLANVTDGVTSEPFDLSQQIRNLEYSWYDQESYSHRMMETVHVNAGSTKIMEFDFTATDDIPVGNTVRIFLTEAWWTDNTTGNKVWPVSGAGGTELAVTYTIVE